VAIVERLHTWAAGQEDDVREWLERLLVVAATGAVLVVNAIAGAAGLNGVTTGEVARRYDLPFTPAGYVFAIWSLIYLGLLAFTVAQLRGATARSPRVAAVRAVYVFSAVANVAWLWFWHHEALLASLGVMLLLLGSLAAAYRHVASSVASTAAEGWCLDLPFRLYFAWISVATLANLGTVLAAGALAGIQPAPLPLSQGLVAATFVLGALAWRRLRDPVFLGVIAWALAGIALKAGQLPAVSAPAMLGCALAGLGAIGLLLDAGPGGGRQPATG
jgi:hypothetical protein